MVYTIYIPLMQMGIYRIMSINDARKLVCLLSSLVFDLAQKVKVEQWPIVNLAIAHANM